MIQLLIALALSAFLMLAPAPAAAQVLPTAVGTHYGAAVFFEAETHVVTGISLRKYLTTRTALEPEFLYMRGGRDDHDFSVIPSLTYDLNSSSRSRLYASGGAGLLVHKGYSNCTFLPTFGGGLGVRTYIGRWFISPEVRIGLEPVIRFTTSVGYTFSARGGTSR